MTLDGIPVGTLRSNMSDTKVTPDEWCQRMGSHRYSIDADGIKWCKDCFKTEKEINEQNAREQRGNRNSSN